MFIQRRFWLLPLHLHITVSYIFLCLNEWRLPSWKWIMNVFTLRIRCFCSRRMWRSCIQEHKCAQMGSASLPSYHLRGTELCKTKDKAGCGEISSLKPPLGPHRETKGEQPGGAKPQQRCDSCRSFSSPCFPSFFCHSLPIFDLCFCIVVGLFF